jgi:hypothetical protein
MIRKPSGSGSLAGRWGRSSGTFAWRNASLISIVSRGNLRGRISAGTPRAAILRAVGERWEHQRARGDVGAHGAGHPERDEPGAAGRQIPGGAEQLDLRRREVDRDRVAGDRAVLAPERPPEVVARPQLEGGVALAEPERAALHHEGNLHAPAERALLLGHRRRRARLHDPNLDPRHVAAPGFEHERERRLLAEEARRRRQGLDPGNRLAPAEIRHRADHGEEQDQDEEHPGFRARPLGHEADDTMPSADGRRRRSRIRRPLARVGRRRRGANLDTRRDRSVA